MRHGQDLDGIGRLPVNDDEWKARQFDLPRAASSKRPTLRRGEKFFDHLVDFFDEPGRSPEDCDCGTNARRPLPPQLRLDERRFALRSFDGGGKPSAGLLKSDRLGPAGIQLSHAPGDLLVPCRGDRFVLCTIQAFNQ
jgi:hypothetical protein